MVLNFKLLLHDVVFCVGAIGWETINNIHDKVYKEIFK
jgi:hypothetical protein